MASVFAARGSLVGLGIGLAVLACSPVDEVERAEVDEVGVARLARVHVIVQPDADPLGALPQLDVRASFVHYRGLDDDFVRGRLGLVPLAHERVELGTCVASDTLDGVDFGERPPAGERELVLVDAGNLHLRLGDHDVDVPLVLLPDLLPYMAGVEYEQVSEYLPSVVVLGERAPLTIEIEGSGDEEIPPTTLETRLPPALDLESRLGLDPGIVEVTWGGSSRSPLVLRLAAYVGSEPSGDEVTCVVPDSGSFRLDLAELRGLGLGVAGEGLHVSASRVVVQSFDAGEFAGGELIVELRDSLFTVLP
ncbi:MAG: hypothetical protein H6711_14585 [Myxococcales bacterium]|nr:hypothetical protein [Myxococcales bacterium]